jgi:hypothetical protein
MRDVEINFRVSDEAVVRDDRHALLFRRLNYFGCDHAVVRGDDQDIRALGQHTLGLIDLRGVVAIGDQHGQFSADFFGALFDQFFVALPALFFERVHRKADLHGACLLRLVGAISCGLLLRPADATREQ